MMRVVAACATGLLLAGWSGPALAWTAEISWPTFYRDGPDKHYTVIDEFDRGTRVEVLSCTGTWCQVRKDRNVGYVERMDLITPDEMPQKPAAQPASPECFDSRLDGYGKGELYHYCPQ